MQEAQEASELSRRLGDAAAAVSLALLRLYEVDRCRSPHRLEMYRSQIRQWFQFPNFFHQIINSRPVITC